MSTCSPTLHGTAPHGSCIATMDAAVAATCSAVRMPSTQGSCPRGSGMRGPRGIVDWRRAAGEGQDFVGCSCCFRLAEVEDHALADQRVEDLAGVLERLGLL